MQMQTDLNKVTLDCVEANSSVTDIIGLYNGQWHDRAVISHVTARWSRALNSLADSLEKFQVDAAKLEEYLNAQE